MFSLDAGDQIGVERKSQAQLVADWKKSMLQAYELANQNISKAAEYDKKNYDKNVHGEELQKGDQVLIRNMREKGGNGKHTTL